MARIFVQVISKQELLYFALALQKLYSLKAIYIFYFSGNLLLRESPFHTVNCLKSFDFKLFFVYALVVEGLFGTFILTKEKLHLHQSLLNVTGAGFFSVIDRIFFKLPKNIKLFRCRSDSLKI